MRSSGGHIHGPLEVHTDPRQSHVNLTDELRYNATPDNLGLLRTMLPIR
jgi:hypothetical protein